MGAAGHHSNPTLAILSGAVLLLAIVLIANPRIQWRLLRDRLQGPADPPRSWVIVMRSVSGLVAVVAATLLVVGLTRL